MNTKTAYKLGVASGLEAAELGAFTRDELSDGDSFITACYEICENKRQYAGHPGYDFNSEPNTVGLWEAFEKGEAVGIQKGWFKRKRDIQSINVRFDLLELRELYRCINVCLLDEAYSKPVQTYSIFEKVKAANKRLLGR